MAKRRHEVRDALHVFVDFDDDERRVIDCPAFQRLRNIHQLALTYEVYPGASHKRFEHSLGVMHLAGRAYDVITRPDRVSEAVRETIPATDQDDFGYWRKVVRVAALCHDMGHLPFSHAAEEELLPEGVDHERITWDIIHSEPMRAIFDEIIPSPKPDHVGKLAIGPRKAERLGLNVDFSDWEAILAEVIVGDAFGVDRMDYLLRDSIHTGVQYGRFDHDRLINTLRVIPEPRREEDEADAGATPPVLGCERGGLHSAEQLLLARYFMFSQVYHHPTRLAYNEHLKDFLTAWLPDGHFPADVAGHLGRDDADVLLAIKTAAADPGHPGHGPAKRIVSRDHFKKAYEKKSNPKNDQDLRGDRTGDVRTLADAAAEHFGPGLIAYGAPPSNKPPDDFAVYDREGRDSVWATGLSDVLRTLPQSPDEFVLADAEIRDEVTDWLEANRTRILEEARKRQIREAEEEVE
jgi:uncharacterized protein